MPEQDQAQRHGPPRQTEPRSHGVYHETPHVNLNTADRREIEHLPIMGAKRAAELIRARPFKNWEDIAKVLEFSPGMMDVLRSAGAELG